MLSRSVRPTVGLSVRLSRSWITSKRINISSIFFSFSGSDTILVFPYQRGADIPTGTPLTGVSNVMGSMKKWRFSTNISLYLRNGYSQMGTFSETICKHRIPFPPIQHLAWLPQGKPKCDKNSNFWNYALTYTIDRYMLRGVWQALNCLSIHGTYCVIINNTRHRTASLR